MLNKKRKDCFLGIHFDFHAMPGEEVPAIYCPELYGAMLDAVHPDYVQCDTKGHAGLSSYPSKVGNRAKLKDGIDILRMMRDATAKRGIPLYGHHSGLYDRKAVELHPDWAVINIDGEPEKDIVSAFSPYVDELLVPQLRELAGEYHLDGAWIDGDSWMAQVDYSHWATDAYKEKYCKVPPRPGDADYENYREFCRDGFRSYVRHYIDTIKAEFPEFQITSNWIFSAMMPEKLDVNVDFLSGDYAPENALESARFHGRVLECRNIAWDLLAWGQHALPCCWKTRNRNTKELQQYCQEASMTIAMGGGFEFFNIHYGSGGLIQEWAIPIWRKTAEYCREREVCFGSRIMPELGVLLPCDRNAEENTRLYCNAPGGLALEKWINALQDCQYSSKVLLEHHIVEQELSQYRIIVIPAAERICETAQKALCQYVNAGGILLVDTGSAQFFETFGGYSSSAPETKLIFVDSGNALAAGEVACKTFQTKEAEGFGRIFPNNFYADEHSFAGYIRHTGKGCIGILTFDFGSFYADNRSTAIRKFLQNTLEKLGYRPTIRVSGSSFADLTVTTKDGELLVSLINTAGEHNVKPVRSYGEIPPIGPLTVTFAPELGVKSIQAIPRNQELELKHNVDGSCTITIERIEIHTVLKIKHNN
ncbi:MAG: hypothetical protein GX927_08235 [Lentisphaerae bacterium]|nr:hypothetical protein [Lentisphaerota bacterium]